MPLWTSPTAFRLASFNAAFSNMNASTIDWSHPAAAFSQSPITFLAETRPPPHSSHPNIGHLTLLVFEAVLEVVCVSLPGYIVARQGLLDAESQKFLANLNVMLFTPCLIFTKLASQLTANKLVELAVIPFIFAIQTLVSYLSSVAITKLFRLQKRPQNFVIAMGVFGNSNSLPISLVLSLSKTISGLHWDRIPGDNDNEVGARGILYLLIFQQLGQLLRWSWGYHVLLAPAEKVEGTPEHIDSRLEQGQEPYRDNPEHEDLVDAADTRNDDDLAENEEYDGSGDQTPVTDRLYASSVSSPLSLEPHKVRAGQLPVIVPTPANGNVMPHIGMGDGITSFPSIRAIVQPSDESAPNGIRGSINRCKLALQDGISKTANSISVNSQSGFQRLPVSAQKVLKKAYQWTMRFCYGVWGFMNPPLWAMLAAILVASVPSLQSLFFTEGTFIRNSVTGAISQSGAVAVPLILVVLGANLARNTLPTEADHSIEDDKEDRKLLIASLISRMVLPTVIMAPVLALTFKFIPVSILDDPIFVIVCFLLTGAPSALQLAQICQINGVYMRAMSKILFQSYVVWILPSTLILVMLALEVVEWAVV